MNLSVTTVTDPRVHLFNINWHLGILKEETFTCFKASPYFKSKLQFLIFEIKYSFNPPFPGVKYFFPLMSGCPFSSPSCHLSRGGSRTRHGPPDLCCQGQIPRAVSINADTFQWVCLEKQWVRLTCTQCLCVCVCVGVGRLVFRAQPLCGLCGSLWPRSRLRHRAVSCLPFDRSPWTAWTSWVRASLFDCLRALRLWVRFPKSTEILKATAAV